MSTIDRLLSLIAPHECLACQRQGSLLCHPCLLQLKPATDRCYYCHQPSLANMTCPQCYKLSYLRRVSAATVYEGFAKQLIWHLKFGGAQAAVRPMVACLSRLALPKGLVVVPVPTASSRMRRRGYDQAVLLAHALARQRNMTYRNCLRRSGQAHQVGSNRAQRRQQLLDAFHVARQRSVEGKHILLVDDVVTTGATFEAAARALLLVGATSVSGVAFARAE